MSADLKAVSKRARVRGVPGRSGGVGGSGTSAWARSTAPAEEAIDEFASPAALAAATCKFLDETPTPFHLCAVASTPQRFFAVEVWGPSLLQKPSTASPPTRICTL